MANALIEKQNELQAKQERFAKFVEDMGPEHRVELITSVEGDTAAKEAALKEALAEMNAAGEAVDKQQEVEKGIEEAKEWEKYLKEPASKVHFPGGNGDKPDQRGPVKSLGTSFLESKAFTTYRDQGIPGIKYTRDDISLKALLTSQSLTYTGAPADSLQGFLPESTRTGDIVEMARRPVQLLGRLRQTPIAVPQVKYMEQIRRDSISGLEAGAGATAVAPGTGEGQAYSPAFFRWQEASEDVKKRGVFTPISDEQLDDVPGMQSLVEGELVDLIGEDADHQLINGNGGLVGASADLNGILSSSRSNIGSVAKGAGDPILTALLKGLKEVRVTGRASPDMFLMNPENWYDDLAPTQVATGAYLLAAPSEEVLMRAWGLPVVLVDAVPAGTVIVGDFARHCYVRDKQDVQVSIGPRYATDMLAAGSIPTGGTTLYTQPAGQMNIWADVRLAFVIRRETAFCAITGI